MAITKSEAYQIASKFLEQELCKAYPCQIIEEATKEIDEGWIFFYQTKAYLETGDPIKAFAGNAPIIVNRSDGSIHITGTAYSLDKYIEEYKNEKQDKRNF